MTDEAQVPEEAGTIAEMEQDLRSQLSAAQEETVELEEKQLEPEAETPPEETPEQARARQDGWCPKEEWRGDPDKWVDAKTFNQRGELFGTIKSLKQELEAVKKGNQTLLQHHEQLRKAKHEELLADLREKRRQAVEEADTESFEQYDRKIKEAETQPVDDKPEPEPEQNQAPELPQEVLDWHKENQWFKTEGEPDEKTEFMVFKQQQYVQRGLSPKEALEKATNDVKRTYAHEFENPNKDRPGTVESGVRESGSKKSITARDLPAEYQRAYQEIKRVSGMSLEDYVKDLKAAGIEIGGKS